MKTKAIRKSNQKRLFSQAEINDSLAPEGHDDSDQNPSDTSDGGKPSSDEPMEWK